MSPSANPGPMMIRRSHAMFVRHRLAVVAIALSVIAAPFPAFGQSDTREMQNRIQRLENEIQTLNREVYRGAPRPSGSAAPAAGMGGTVAAEFEVRLQRLEAEMQGLTGRYEEAVFQVTQLREQLAKLQTDMEFRLNRLEQGSGAGALAPAAGGSAPASTASSGTAPTAEPAATTSNLPTGSVQEMYDAAFNLIRRADYPAAEQAFARFLKAHPDSQLAGNAQYWLGETLYVRGKHQDAAVAFAEGFQKYPKGNKAPDSLLKLSLSLSALNQREDACVALRELQTRYKDAVEPIKRRAEAERSRLKCG